MALTDDVVNAIGQLASVSDGYADELTELAAAVPADPQTNPNNCAAELAFKNAMHALKTKSESIKQTTAAMASSAESMDSIIGDLCDIADQMYAECEDPPDP